MQNFQAFDLQGLKQHIMGQEQEGQILQIEMKMQLVAFNFVFEEGLKQHPHHQIQN